MMWFGWEKFYIDNDGAPVNYSTNWKASCFVLFTHIIYVGKIEGANHE